MSEFQKQAEDILKSEITNTGLEITPKENGREGVDFIVKSPNGKQSEVALIGFIPNVEPLIFLIPSKILVNTDDFVFFENNVGRHKYLSNWEIKVFTKGMEKLGGNIIYNQIANFK